MKGWAYMTIQLRLLTTSDVEDLYPRLRLEDKEEVICLGSNSREALLMGAFDNVFSGISNGRAYALVTEEDQVIGAVGYSSSGFLWALCTKFSASEIRELFWRTPEILDFLVDEAKKRGALFKGDSFLHNMIHARNRPAMKWLEKSGRFAIDRENAIDVSGETFYSFRTLMDHELAHV